MEPRKQKKLGEILHVLICSMFLFAVSVLVVVQLSSEFPEGLMNNPVYIMLQYIGEFGLVHALKEYGGQGVGV
jgi:hypothetical protein